MSSKNRRVAVAEFEEKTFEIAYDIELSKGLGPSVWAPGQVLEHLVGFDASANPDPTHPLWRVLRTPRPRGVVLLPDHWSGLDRKRAPRRALPSDPVSFIVQYKRPEFIKSHAAKQWSMWRVPYFRFRVDDDQQKVLKRLETTTAGEALVRYAAPAFYTHGDMDAARIAEQVIASSGHVPPSTLAGHRYWTYLSPGTSGLPNPRDNERNFDRLSELFREPDDFRERDNVDPSTESGIRVGNGIARFDSMPVHVAVLAEAAVTREPRLRRLMRQWQRELVRSQLPLDVVESVVNYSTIQTLLSQLGSSWWVLDKSSLAETASNR